MSRDAARSSTPPKSKGEKEPVKTNKAIFLAAITDLTWRMALVVLVPLIGGFKLDEALHTSPALAILGFVVAMAGLFVVMKQAVATADERFGSKGASR